MNEKFDLPLDKENKEQPKKKILVADDDHVLQAGMKMVLEDLGYHVLTVSSAEELLEVLRSGEKVDALLTDNNMKQKGMDGIEAIEQLRKDPAFADLPIVLHSGGKAEELAQRTKELGARFLQKPYAFDELGPIMEELFNKDKE